MSIRGSALILAIAVVGMALITPEAQAAAPPKLHTVEVADASEGPFVCGDLTLTLTGGSQIEKVEAVQIGDVIHYNLVRNYRDLSFLGSDGVVYGATAVTHATVLLDATLDEPAPISVREVLELTFGRGAGRLHEVIVQTPSVDTDTVTGTCTYAQ
jgi:hypothetical protein